MTIRQYIILQRITVAKQLLCTSSDIQKLPQVLGFSDYAHFAKTFKRLTGMTPKQFRLQNYQALKNPRDMLSGKVMGGQGIEPWTHGLRVRCSAS